LVDIPRHGRKNGHAMPSNFLEKWRCLVSGNGFMPNIRKLNHLRGAKLDETNRLHFATIYWACTYFGIFIDMSISIISFFVPILRFLGVLSDLGFSFDIKAWSPC
jgi:hypothetical protein